MRNSILCHPCCVSKSHRLLYVSSLTEYALPLELIHSDLWGPSPTPSRNGYVYYVTFVDHFSRYTWMYLLKAKSEVKEVFLHFKASVENELNSKIKMLQSDWGGEYQALTNILQEFGIKHRVSCPYTPQQNGLAERKHRHIVEMGSSLLAQAGMPNELWDDAFTTAIFLINRVPTKVLKFLTPYEKLYNTKPDYHSLKVFGCLCYPFTRPYNQNKLQHRSQAAVFLGYSPKHKGFKAMLKNGKVLITRDIIFDESVFPFQSNHHDTSSQTDYSTPFSPILSAPTPVHGLPLLSHTTTSPQTSNQSIIQTPPHNASPPTTSPSMPTSHSTPYHSPANVSTDSNTSPPSHFTNMSPISMTTPPLIQPLASQHPMITRARAGIFKPKLYNAMLSSSTYPLPKSASAALLIPVWKTAMFEEYSALLRNKTWVLTLLPPGKNLIGCTWIFRLKRHADGTIARHKARIPFA